MEKILIFSGSTRQDSLNHKLAQLAEDSVKRAGAEATFVDLRQLAMPLFSQDIEKQGMPADALVFKNYLLEHDAFMIASPEYNGCFSPMLKNAIDWASRSHQENEAPLSAFRNKKVALMATSPGSLGGMRGLVMLRMLLANIGVTVIGKQLTVAKGHEVFANDSVHGVSESVRKNMDQLVAELVKIL